MNIYRNLYLIATVAAICFVTSPTAAPADEPRVESQPSTAADTHHQISWALVVHAGAGAEPSRLSPEHRAACEKSLRKAAEVGRRILSDGGTSLDAVEQVIRFLEDDPLFNAGRGAVFNAAGRHEMDASIMDGRTLACGAASAVTTVKNPITLARTVMEKSPHVLLTAEGAGEFARKMKLDMVDADQKYFSTQPRYQEWQKAVEQEKVGEPDIRQQPAPKDVRDTSGKNDQHGTVGCVALDTHGNLAAGTSTGGRTNKYVGRVGDSPIVGAGTYADDRTCAVSCTGVGEEYIRHAAAYDVSARMRYTGASLQEAVHAVIHETLKKGEGGMIGVDRHGNSVIDFNTPGMYRAVADSTGKLEVKIGGK